MDGKQEGGKPEGGTVSKEEGWLARGGNGKQGQARGRDSKQGGGDMRSCSIRLKLSSSCICKQLYSTRQPSCCGGQQSHTGGMAKMKMIYLCKQLYRCPHGHWQCCMVQRK